MRQEALCFISGYRRNKFLDLNVSRGVQGNLETNVYRKPTHTDKYLAFDSHHPICHKKSVAKNLHRRADCLPSSLDSKAENLLVAANYIINLVELDKPSMKPYVTDYK